MKRYKKKSNSFLIITSLICGVILIAISIFLHFNDNKIAISIEKESYDIAPTFTAQPSFTPNPTNEPTNEPTPEPTPEPEPYVITWISDTQGYSRYMPEIFDSMTNWIADNTDDLNIQYVLHTGDIVDTYDSSKEWENANNALSVLDGIVPLFTVAGNHDINSGNHKYANYLKYFGEDRFNMLDTFGGSYKGGRGRYDLIDINGKPIILISIGYSVVSDDIDWMNQVLKQHSNRTAILCFHGYMDPDESYTSDGKRLFPEVVSVNQNVKLVLCGHRHGIAHNTVMFDDDGDGIEERTVYQVLFNYQTGRNYGGGYLSLLSFDSQAETLKFKTYSPYYDDYVYFDDQSDLEDFSIPWE